MAVKLTSRQEVPGIGYGKGGFNRLQRQTGVPETCPGLSKMGALQRDDIPDVPRAIFMHSFLRRIHRKHNTTDCFTKNILVFDILEILKCIFSYLYFWKLVIRNSI